jgi:ribosomal protein L44E
VAEEETLKCDFCERDVSQVRRVALDEGYDRLTRRHEIRYACPECSERKDRERRERLVDDAAEPA